MSTLPSLKVFVSHCSVDKPAVSQLVDALLARGIDAWYDAYEIGPGDDIVAKLNEGLTSRDAGLVIFSANTDQGRWAMSEISTLFHERVQEGKVLIPVILGEGAKIPSLIKPLARVRIDEVDRIVDAIYHRRVKPPLGAAARPVAAHAVAISLARGATGEIDVRVDLDGATLASCTHAALPRELVSLRDEFLSGFRHATLRSPLAIERKAKEVSVAALGRALAAFCLPAHAASALAAVLDRDGRIPGASIEIAIQGGDAVLASLPYESLRLPDSDLLLVDHPAVTMVRRPANLVWPLTGPLAGPLKILVAVGAPDEGKTENNALDHERELQNILDAVEPAQRSENVEVRILEASDPATIGEALKRDQYHVLYITGHGRPGALELDDEEGKAVEVTAEALLDALHGANRPAPLMFLNTCHGAVDRAQTASLAELLLHGGVPAVLAMQTSVSDRYGTELARAFFEELSRGEAVLASHALGQARRALERQRRDALTRNTDELLTLPEYATATLFVAGIEAPLVNFGPDKQPLHAPPVHELGGRVPQLRQDDLIGRRRELRRALWVLRPPRDARETTRIVDGLGKGSALALVGIGGVGKSTIAGRVMRRMAEDNFLIASHVGPWDLGAIAAAVGVALIKGGEATRQRGKNLADPDLDDTLRLLLLEEVLGDTPVLLVLDDFEQNLSRDGTAFLDRDLPGYLAHLLEITRRGRVLITSRFPVPGFSALIATFAIGPLTDSDVRKLVLRLPGLQSADAATLRGVLRTIGNHPRMLELLDALVRGGVGRLPHVTRKLNELMAHSAPFGAGDSSDDLAEAVQQAVAAGARDVFLDELLVIARERGLADVLLQTAVSNLPVDAAGIAYMLTDGPAAAEAAVEVTQALRQLEAMSLVFRMPDGGAWVHRWTAEGLARSEPADQQHARLARAGRYRHWLAVHESRDLGDLIEAARNFLRAEAWDDAVIAGDIVIAAFERNHRIGVASFVTEILAALPVDHRAVPRLYDSAGDAHVALGQGDAAYRAYAVSLAINEQRTAQDPANAGHQRGLAVAYNKMGDLYRARGQGQDAHTAYAASLAINERLAAQDPANVGHQLGLSMAYDSMGELYAALGQGKEAHTAYAAALAICERLAAQEPTHADYQRNLSVSHVRMGDLYRARGQGDEARKAYATSLAIIEGLAAKEPARADYQRDLSVFHDRMGAVYRAWGQGEEARTAYAASLAIAERLAAQEPARADYQRDLAISHSNMGDFFRAFGDAGEARAAYAAALANTERLVELDPTRADYQYDLALYHGRIGDVQRLLGQPAEARAAYRSALAITERLAGQEPARATYQRSLSVLYTRLATLAKLDGHTEEARTWFERDLEIAERLAAADPTRADYQVDVAMSLMTTAPYVGSDARSRLERAAAILHSLDAQGRLTPVDRAKVERVTKMLAALSS